MIAVSDPEVAHHLRVIIIARSVFFLLHFDIALRASTIQFRSKAKLSNRLKTRQIDSGQKEDEVDSDLRY
jgi:hypothetical protein